MRGNIASSEGATNTTQTLIHLVRRCIVDILPQIIPLKQCRSCPEGQQWHPATSDFFPRNKTKKDGLESRCKACHRAQTKAYALANPDKVSLRGRRYHLANPM